MAEIRTAERGYIRGMPERQTILVVEDDEALRRLVRTALVLAGYNVVEAGDGFEALRRIDHSPPDLVILDLVLPVLSGITVRQEIAAHAVTRQIPIVVITGSAIDPKDLKVDCFLRKPISPDQLLETVRTCLASGARGLT
ncbi:MAG: response regulator [Acidobacteria bacterium]|nr:response regulator [Acidobacteriota bacterium]